MMDFRVAAGRLLYIVLYAAYRAYCFVFRPTIEVVQIIVRHGDEYLVVRHSYRNFGMYDFIGGRKEKGETFETAAKRELEEETGMLAEHLVLIDKGSAYSDFQTVTFHFYEAEVSSRILHLDRVELVEGKWVPSDKVEEMISPFSKLEWNAYLSKRK